MKFNNKLGKKQSNVSLTCWSIGYTYGIKQINILLVHAAYYICQLQLRLVDDAFRPVKTKYLHAVVPLIAHTYIRILPTIPAERKLALFLCI